MSHKLHRLRGGRSYAEIARAAKCSTPTVRQIEAGRTKNPSVELMRRLAGHYRVSLDWLTDPETDFPPVLASAADAAADTVRQLFAAGGMVGELTEQERTLLAAWRVLSPTNQVLMFGRLQGMVDAEVGSAQAKQPTKQVDEVGRHAAAALASRLAEAAELFRAHGAKSQPAGKGRRKAEAG